MWFVDMVVNAAILTAACCTGLFLLRTLPSSVSSRLTNPIFFGFGLGLTGIVLMAKSINADFVAMLDLRFVPILLAALYSNRLGIFISAVVIALGRILFFEHTFSPHYAFFYTLAMAVGFSVLSSLKSPRPLVIVYMNVYACFILHVSLNPITYSWVKALNIACFVFPFSLTASFVIWWLIEYFMSFSQLYSRQMIELIPEPILVVSKQKILYANPAGNRILTNESAQSVIGKPISHYLTHLEYVNFEKMFECVMKEGIPSKDMEWTIQREEGLFSSLSIKAIPVLIFQERALQLICRDITEIRRREEQLQQSEHKFRMLVEQALVGVYVIQDGKFLYVNPRMADMLGYVQEQIVGLLAEDVIYPEDMELVRRNIDLKLSGKVEVTPYRCRFIRKDQQTIIVEVIGAKTMLDGNPAIIGTVQDMTVQTKSQELLRQADKLSVVGQLAAGVAHEIRNPLTALKGFLQLMNNKETQKYTGIMMEELERINSILGEFMFLAKPKQLVLRPIDLMEILRDVVTLMNTHAILSNISVLLSTQSGQVYVNGDESQLKQVIVNVLKNAIEAMSESGTIMIEVRLSERDVTIQLQDQGPGIEKDVMERLFNPFFTTKVNGTGLGLMICRQIMENHGGSFHLFSEPGVGTTVELRLPLFNYIS